MGIWRQETELPYDFDLVYDIKTQDQLNQEYTWAVNKVRGLEELAKHHNITLPVVPIAE
jgi:hypothetical protein